MHANCPVANPIPTKRGDALVLYTKTTFVIHAIGRVRENGQQDFTGQHDVTHIAAREAALTKAKSLAQTGGRVFLRDIDNDQWLELAAPVPRSAAQAMDQRAERQERAEA